MKKIGRILMAAVLVTVCTLFAVPASAETTTTIMLYLCGSDLQEYALDNLYTMASIDIPDNVNIVVWAGGTDEWDDEDLAHEAVTSLKVEYDTFADMFVVGEENMGDGDTLYDFMTYSAEQYPADRYGLILWDHGGGAAGGICYDETWNDDMLSMAEINDAMYRYIVEDGAPKFDFIGCDACLMASYEMAVHLMYYADYFVASQELEPGFGWGYDEWLYDFCENPEMSTEELCRTIADGYYELCSMDDSDEYFTQSVIYLPAMESLNAYMEQFSQYLTEALDSGELANFSRKRDRMFEFGSFYDQSGDMVDMAQLISAYSDYAPKTAKNVLSTLEQAVVYVRNGDSVENACGLSILMPRYTVEDFDDYADDYDALGYNEEYAHFLTEYVAAVCGGDYVFTEQTPVQLSTDEMDSSAFLESMLDWIFPDTQYEADEDMITDVLEPSQEWTFDIYGQQAPEEMLDPDGAYAYSMQLNQDEIENLSYVEGMLMMDVGDGETLVDMGYLRNAWIDWQNATVYSMFDGRWPVLEGQPVAIYEQTSNQISRRALIPVSVNDEYCYMIVVFDAQSPEGRVVGYSEGYTDDGYPVRGTSKFEYGDVVTPVYTMYYTDEYGDVVEDSFEGDPIVVESDQWDFEFVSLEDSDTSFLYCFCLNDIYGDYQLSDGIVFEF